MRARTPANPTPVDAAWADLVEIMKALRAKPNAHNAAAAKAAVDGYAETWLADFHGEGAAMPDSALAAEEDRKPKRAREAA